MGNCCGSAWRITTTQTRPSIESSSSRQGYQALHSGNLTPAGNPLPPVVHKVITQQELGPGRLVIVGDVHGCLTELFELLDTVHFHHGFDNLILTGDVCNKGPQCQETVAAVRLLCESTAWVCRGNNDDKALAAWWGLQQGIVPSEPKLSWVDQLLPEDVQFLMDMPFSLRLDSYDLIVVHGGLVPGVPLEQQDLGLLAAMRDILVQPDGSYVGLERASEGSVPWAPLWQGPQHVIFGHDSIRRLQACSCATGIDTGCVIGGQLTACILPPLKQLRQSPAFNAAVQQNLPLSLRDLQGYLVSIPSSVDVPDS